MRKKPFNIQGRAEREAWERNVTPLYSTIFDFWSANLGVAVNYKKLSFFLTKVQRFKFGNFKNSTLRAHEFILRPR